LHKNAILIIVNPGAGKAAYQPKLEYIYRKLQEHNCTFGTFFTEKTQPTGKLRKVLLESQGKREIWILGGDGTLNYVVNELGDFPAICSIVSGGTGNDTVKSLHGITDFEEQVAIALTGKVKYYDLGVCNNRLFVNGVGIGFDGRVVENMVRKGKDKRSHLAYLFTVLKLLAGYREQILEYTIDDVQHRERLFLLTVSNGTTFGGGFVINPDAKTDDGLLDICTIDKIHPLSRFKHVPKLKDGSHAKLKIVHFHQARAITIEGNEKVVAHMDGEFIGSPPFNIRIADQKLALRVPS